MTLNSIKKAMRVAMITMATMTSGSLMQAGCDTTGGGYYGGDYSDYGGYGGIDPDAFQAAADDWDAYIRE